MDRETERYRGFAFVEMSDESGEVAMKDKPLDIFQDEHGIWGDNLKSIHALYGITKPPENIMPMCIHWLGYNSVAPFLPYSIRSGNHRLPGFELKTGDLVMFTSVGAGMNINAVCYGYC